MHECVKETKRQTTQRKTKAHNGSDAIVITETSRQGFFVLLTQKKSCEEK